MSSPSPVLDIFINDTDNVPDRLQGGGSKDYDRGPVTERLLSSTRGETRRSGHRHDVGSDGSTTLSERFSNLRIYDRDDGGGGGNSNADTHTIVDGAHTPDRSTTQPLPTLIADNGPVSGRFVDIQRKPSESSFDDAHTSQLQSFLRKSEDGLFVVPGIPRKAQYPRGDPQRTAARKVTLRRHSIGNASDGRDIVGNDQSRPSNIKRSVSCTETPTKPNATRRLACPYLKYAPEIFHLRCKSSYPTIHRLKEHLYRAHEQKPHCFRCGEIFSDESEVKAHLSRPAQICDLAAGVSVEGITTEQMQKLRSKKRKPGVTTKEDKWRDVFQILFPDATHVPEPYYSYFDARSDDQSLFSMNQSDVERIFSDIPSESEDRLFAELEHLYGPLEEPKRQKVLDVVAGFVLRGAQHLSRGKGLPVSNQDVVCLDGSSSGSIVLETTAPDVEASVPDSESSAAQNNPEEPYQSVLQKTFNIDSIEHWQEGPYQKRIGGSLVNISTELTFSEVPPVNDERVGTDIETRPNECATTERPVNNPSGSILSETYAFDTSDPYENFDSFLQADGEFFYLDSILSVPKDGL